VHGHQRAVRIMQCIGRDDLLTFLPAGKDGNS
jgi:hypothetical protein